MALLSPACYPSFAQDIPGSKDHHLVTRYPGSDIKYYEVQNFKSYRIATGPVTGYKKIDQWLNAEGSFTRIYYVVKGTRTLDEIYQNYLSAFKKAGFTILAQGINATRNVGKGIGERTFLNVFYEQNPFPSSESIQINAGSATSAGTCYLAARLSKGSSSVYAVLGGSQYKSDEKVFILDIVEEKVVEDDLITVSAAEMKAGIQRDGKIALYGIHFDFDKGDIKPESKPALDEIAGLMNANPAMNLYVVGHTDMKGTHSYNMDLSERRAKAIVKELTGKYSIAATRLMADGVGSLAPLASNNTDAGRKLNRRVELVER